MGDIISESISFINNNYSEMKIKSFENYVIFEGRFIINAQYKDIEINRAPKLMMIVPRNYPINLPKVYELENKIENVHKLDDGSLCVATIFDLYLELSRSFNIEDYINKFLIPYFISYEQWCNTGEYIYGDRSHGSVGIYESIAEYFNINPLEKGVIKNLLKWASKKQKFTYIFKTNKQCNLKIKYNYKIAELRKSGIINLRKIYKNLDNIEKLYFQYQLNALYQKLNK